MATFLNLEDLSDIVIDCKHPFHSSDICLACLHGDGRLRLLTGAWEMLLGYQQPELDGRWLYSLLADERSAAKAAVRRLLDPAEADPLMLNVRMKGGASRTLSVFRRFDPYEPALYLACEPFEDKGPPMSRISSAMSFRSSP